MNKLQGKVALITGGNSGIGYATAELFLAEGAEVIITGRNDAALQEAVRKLGPQASSIVSNADDISQLRTLAGQVGRPIDVLFINAGVGIFSPFEQMTEADFDANMDVNFKGAFFTIQSLLPLLHDGASVILNTSINAHIGMAGASAYAASKAALLTLARNLSQELLPRRIRVNAISPGPVATPLFGKMGLPEEAVQQIAAGIQSQIPLGRFGQPEEIAKAALFFAADDSSFVLGAELIVDGGMATL